MLEGLILESNSHFSQSTWFPYYIFDMKRKINFNSLNIDGFIGETIQKLLIYISEDGKNFSLVKIIEEFNYSSNNHIFSLDKIYINIRYIKLASSSFSFLYIKKLLCDEIKNEIKNEIKSEIKSENTNTCVFSCLYSEDSNFIEPYIENFLKFTDENCYLILNLGDRYEYEYSYIEDINKNNKRIFIYYGTIERAISGETLLRGHIESFNKAKTYLKTFNYFCTIASNSLFVRKFSLETVVDTFKFAVKNPISTDRSYEDDVDVDKDFKNLKPSHSWTWRSLIESEEIQTTLEEILDTDKYHASQIEGMFCSYNAWNYISNLDNKIKNIENCKGKYDFLPLEEMIPSSILFEKFPNEQTNICYVLWKSGRRSVDINSLCDLVPFLPQHISLIKWFGRSPHDSAVNFINSDVSDGLFSIIKSLVSDKKTFFLKDDMISCFNDGVINKIIKEEKQYLLSNNDCITFNFIMKEILKIYSLHEDFFIHSERFEKEINSSIIYQKEDNKYIFNVCLKTMTMEKYYEITSYLYINISQLKFLKIYFENEFDIEKFVIFTNGSYFDIRNDTFKKISNHLYSLDFCHINQPLSDTYFLGVPIKANVDMRFSIIY